MNPLLEVERLSVRSPQALILDNLSLDLAAGLHVVEGPSGSGKSTLLRALLGILPPSWVEGRVCIAGIDPFPSGRRRVAQVVGFSPQDPTKSFLGVTVEGELEVRLLFQGIEEGRREWIERQARKWEILHLLSRPVWTLSHGEARRVSLACSTLLSPPHVALDEPFTGLDSKSRSLLLSELRSLAREHLVLVVEHSTEEIEPWADTYVRLENGKLAPSRTRPPPLPPRTPRFRPSTVASVRSLRVEKGGRTILEVPDVEIHEGVTALVGENGSGKTTFLRTLAGLERPSEGEVRILGKEISRLKPPALSRLVGFAQERPEEVFLGTTVEDEAMWTLKALSLEGEDLSEVLRKARLDHLRKRLPQTLSGGEAQRLHVISSLLHHPPLLLLDEPTAGLDFESRRWIFEVLDSWKGAVVVATHDREFAEKADSVLQIERGVLRRVR